MLSFHELLENDSFYFIVGVSLLCALSVVFLAFYWLSIVLARFSLKIASISSLNS